jgi:hypothetical protein
MTDLLETPLVEVRLLGFPLELYSKAHEHSEDLRREFALLALQPPAELAEHDVPARLLALIEELGNRFQPLVKATHDERDAALAAGAKTVDLRYQVPASVRDAAIHLGELLDAADEFCRSGALLTLATPAECVRFRRWYLAEFVRQVDGHAPVPWRDYGG